MWVTPLSVGTIVQLSFVQGLFFFLKGCKGGQRVNIIMFYKHGKTGEICKIPTSRRNVENLILILSASQLPEDFSRVCFTFLVYLYSGLNFSLSCFEFFRKNILLGICIYLYT